MFFKKVLDIPFWVCTLLLVTQTVATTVCSTEYEADFVFLLDTSGSMCPYIGGIIKNYQALVEAIGALHIDAQFAVATFGGKTVLRSPLTSNLTETLSVMSSLKCDTNGREASLEAIRRILNDDFQAYNKHLGTRPNATLNILLVTDEDSDLPFGTNYHSPNQALEVFYGTNMAEPGWYGYMTTLQMTFSSGSTMKTTTLPSGYVYSTTLSGQSTPTLVTATAAFNYTVPYVMPVRTAAGVPTLSPAFQAEVDATAQLITKKNAKVSIAMKRNTNGVRKNIVDSFDSNSTGNAYSYLCLNQTNYGFNYKKSLTNFDCSEEDTFGIWTGALQFGSVSAAHENDDYTGFAWDLTLDSLVEHGLGNSLQAQVLNGGAGIVRLYDIAVLNNTEKADVVTNMLHQLAGDFNYCKTAYSRIRTTETSVLLVTHVPTSIVTSYTYATEVRVLTSGSYETVTYTSVATEVVTTSPVVEHVTFTETSTRTVVVTATTVIQSAVPTVAGGSNNTPVYVGASIAGAAAVAGAAAALFYFRSSATVTSGLAIGGEGIFSDVSNPLYSADGPGGRTQHANPMYEHAEVDFEI